MYPLSLGLLAEWCLTAPAAGDGDGDGNGNGNWDRDRDWYEGDDENVGGGRQQLRRHVRC